MHHSPRRFRSSRRALGFLAVALVSSAAFCADAAFEFDLPQEPLADALRDLGAQANINVLYDPPTVAGRIAPALKARLSSREALARLLKDTGLEYEFVSDKTVAVHPPALQVIREQAPPRASVATTGAGAIQLAQADTAVPSGAEPAVNADDPRRGSPASTIEEIVVTAQKREERLLDVPVPVSAINAQSLASSNQLRLQDYYSQVPGLNLTPSTQSGQILSVRGISAGSGNPTVGVTIDDVPLGSSTFLGGGAGVPDIDPADLARIEVLRGPQGTLYGASSISGLLKFVTADPSTAGVSGRIQAVGSSVQHGDAMGYSLRGSVNVPLSDTLAVRASGFTRKDPGYIDNSALGIAGLNESDADGGRLSALWRPRDGLSLKIGALFQKISGSGSSDVLPTSGDLQQAYIRDSGAYDRKVQAYSAVLNADIGAVNLTSVSGYNINQFSDSFDGTFAFGPSTQAAFGVPGTPQFNENRTKKFSQELRFSGHFGKFVDWLLGGVYADEDSEYLQTRLATNPTTGAVAGTVSVLGFPTTYEEYAAFGDLTFHLTDRFDLQLGARQGWIDQSYSSVSVNRLGAATIVPEVSVNTDAFTYLATAKYQWLSNLMTYVRLASGYRAGGPNVTTGAGSAPAAYDPDDSRDYELGMKGGFLHNMLTVDASVYYIDWKDIQLALRDPVTLQSYTDNASAARSKGVELTIEFNPAYGLTIAAWGAYNDAALTKAFPSTSTVRGMPGDRLPFGSKRSGNLSVRQEFPVAARVTGVVSGTAAYVGDRVGRFSAGARDFFPSYTRFDLNAGLRFENWTASLFANNVADKRGVLASGLAPGTKVYIQPRTIGLSFLRDF